LYYNFAPVYKGFDPHNSGDQNTKNNPRHPALGKRFLVNKRYVSTSDFLTPSRDVDWIDRGSEWEELFGPQDQTEEYNPFDVDGDWIAGNVLETEYLGPGPGPGPGPGSTKTTKAVDNPRTYMHKRYDDDWFAAYKRELYEKAGYVQVEYDWLVVDGITFTIEICLDHQMRTALDTFNGDIISGRTTKIPSSITIDGTNGIEYVPIPTHQAQIGLVASAGMSPNPESFALSQNGILFLQDGISNKTSRRFVEKELQQQCGVQQGLQFEGGTVAVRRRAMVSKTDVRFEYELLNGPSHNRNGGGSTASPATAATEETALEHKVPVYDGDSGVDSGSSTSSSDDDENDDFRRGSLPTWKRKLGGIFSTEAYEPHLVIYGPIDIASVGGGS